MDSKIAIIGVVAIFLTFAAGHWIDKDKLPMKRDAKAGQCEAPAVKIVNVTLDNGGKTFPQNDYEKALEKDPNGETLKNFLSEETTRLMTTTKEEMDFEDSYPACLYKKMCEPARELLVYRPVLNSDFKCWNIQPVIWTTCDPRLVEDVSCGDSIGTTGFGYTCLADYARQLLWVYCENGDPFRIMPIYIPFKCQVYKYFCE